MRIKLIVLTFFICQQGFSQFPKNTFLQSKEWSKSNALYKGKFFVLHNIFAPTNNLLKFEIEALAASNSGELTSLVYKCETQNKEGLVLGFFGDYWNEAGVIYTGYSFKNIPKDKAILLLDKLVKYVNDNYKYLDADRDNNNLYFKEDDMEFLFYNPIFNITKIRVLWNGFDAEWDASALFKTQKRLLKKLN